MYNILLMMLTTWFIVATVSKYINFCNYVILWPEI